VVITSWFVATAVAAQVPSVEVEWRKDRATMRLSTPPGLHVAEDAPVDVTYRIGADQFALQLPGARLGEGLPLQDARGRQLDGAMAVSLCEDAGNACHRVTVRFHGSVPNTPRGWLALAVLEGAAAPPVVVAEDSPFQADAQALADAAFAEATASGRKVLLDFTAVWCPPCTLMAAHVLHAAPASPVLDRYVVVGLDADDPSSWALKDRYAVGAYPTVIVAAADGTEIDRAIGYSGAEPFVAWLERASSAAPLPALEGADPGVAAEIAWRLAQRDEDPTAWLAVAAAQPDQLAFRLARVSTTPNLEDVDWLTKHGQGHVEEWIYAATELADQEGGREALQLAIVGDLVDARAATASSLLDALATVSTPDQAPAMFAAAAAQLRTTLSGDPHLDKGYYTDLAYLMEHAGDVDGAVAFLDAASHIFVEEPTFQLAAARTLLRAGRPAEALARADDGLARSWGDNRLRVAASRAEALVALGRPEEASACAALALSEVPVPPDGVDVRTNKYRTTLSAFLAPAP
jgi:thiol-disulfide isomerase/thioredoxin